MGTRKGVSRPDRKAAMSMDSGTNPGDNAKMVMEKIEISSWGDIQMSDPIAVKERCDKYFRFCGEHDSKPSVAGLAFSLGIDRRTLWNYSNGNLGKNQEVRDTVKKAYVFINSLMEDYMQNGKINPVAGIFLMKNNMGYTDKQEVVVTPNTKLGEEPDQKALEDKYIESIVSDD